MPRGSEPRSIPDLATKQELYHKQLLLKKRREVGARVVPCSRLEERLKGQVPHCPGNSIRDGRYLPDQHSIIFSRPSWFSSSPGSVFSHTLCAVNNVFTSCEMENHILS